MSSKKPISDDALDSLLQAAASDVRLAHDSLFDSTLREHQTSVVQQALQQRATQASASISKRSYAHAWLPALGATTLVLVFWAAGRNQLSPSSSVSQPTKLAFLAPSSDYEQESAEGEIELVSFGEFNQLLAEETSDFGLLAVEDESSNFEIPSVTLGISFSDIEYMEDITDEDAY